MLVRLVSSALIALLVRPVDSFKATPASELARRRKKHLFTHEEDGEAFFGFTKQKHGDRGVLERKHVVKEASHYSVSLAVTTKESSDETIECDPRADGKPDVGILSCGTGSRCVEREGSALGGICAFMPKQRSLYPIIRFSDICSGIYETEYDCDCSQLVNGVGPVLCIRSERYCFDVAENYCASLTYEGVVSFHGMMDL